MRSQLLAFFVVVLSVVAWSVATSTDGRDSNSGLTVSTCPLNCAAKLVFVPGGWITSLDQFCVTVVHAGSVCVRPPSDATFHVASNTTHRWSEYAIAPGNASLNGTPYEGAIFSGTTGATQTVVFGSTHPIQHVVVVLMENANPSEVASYGPYENYLAGRYSVATHFYAACHESSPNYHALLSADTDSCNSTFASDESNVGCSPCHDGVPFRNYTVTDLLNNTTSGWTGITESNLTWANFAENLPPVLYDDHVTSTGKGSTEWLTNGLCNGSTFPEYDGGNQGNGSIYDVFVDRHVPVLSEEDTLRPDLKVTVGSTKIDSQEPECFEHLRSLEPYGPDGAVLGDGYGVPCAVTSPTAPGTACTAPPPSFNATVATGTMLNFSFISPNLCDDGHSVCVPCTGALGAGEYNCTVGSGAPGTWQNATCGTCKNGNDAQTIPAADSWVKGFLGALLNCTGPYALGSAHTDCLGEMAHTAFFVLYDESEGISSVKYGGFVWGDSPGALAQDAFGPRGTGYGDNTTHFCATSSAVPHHQDTVCGGPVWETTIVPNSAYANDGVAYTANATDVSVLTTIEWLFGLTPYAGETGVSSGIVGANGGPVFGVCDPSEGDHSPAPVHNSCSDGLWDEYPTYSDTYGPMYSDFSFANNYYCVPGFCQNWGT